MLTSRTEEQPSGATRTLAPVSLKRLARLTSDLALDREQERRAAALLVENPPTAAPVLEDAQAGRLDAILDGFTGSSFDAWTAVPPPLAPPAEAFRRSIDGEVVFLAKLVPILRRSQRDVLASIIEARSVGPLSAGEQ
jgi:hypothetical protein